MNFSVIPEDRYRETMKNTVYPVLDALRKTVTFERAPGEPIYCEHYDAADPKGAVVIVHGFSSSLPKFYECVWYFLQEGFSVWQIQMRGHGRSFRGTDDPDLVYIKDFRDMLLDLRYFVRRLVRPSAVSLPLYLYAHSMGGGLGACYLEQFPDEFEKAVLSSPMLGLQTGRTPLFAAYLMGQLKIRGGKGMEYMPGAAPFSDTPDFENSAATSRARYDEYFEIQKAHREYQMCVLCWQTSLQLLRITQTAMRPERIANISSGILLFQAEHDTFVKPEPQDAFIKQVKSGTLVRVRGAKHEIYRSGDDILPDYWSRIMQFFA